MKPTLPIACLKVSVNDHGDWCETSASDGEPVFFSETVQALVDAAYKAGKADAREWLPIAEASLEDQVLLTDGVVVGEGFWHDGSECYGHRGSAGWFWESDRGNLLIARNAHATHFQHLPPPPEQPK